VDRLHEDILNELEALELPALSWGILDARLSETEIRRVIETVLDAHGDFTTAPDAVRTALQQQAVLLRADDSSEASYRTRLGESLRLFARLRQLFPQHLTAGTWSAAANLVLDYRLIARSRYFPRRDVVPADVFDALVETHRLAPKQIVALRHLLGAHDPSSRLARFQVNATDQILGELGPDHSSSTIITAGTGSGKTRAFYIPALTDVAGALSNDPWTKVLAVYPRVELLKDQLAEVIGQAHRVYVELGEESSRPIRIGAFFGSTPHTNRVSERWGWRQRPDGSLQCPYIACWVCGSPTFWQADDRERRREVLVCRDCGARSLPGQLALTRTGMADNPPDILFTTTEMVNRHLSSLEYGHVFGVGNRARRRPRLLLLDEAHTYSDATGAQAAFVLRRWQHAVAAPVHVVGLSATLEDASTFMARLTGISPSRITEIRPADDDMEARGMEYMLALRGNPMSGTALLSTSIQTLMLLRRVLDLSNGTPSGNAFGSRVFAFTDDLDVTNRLYFNLLDAEGRTFADQPRPGRESLANLRRPDFPDLVARRRDGQVWDAALAIGHSLRNSPVSISRTSSQDAGVDTSSDIVVATASLEVGFDDLHVGGVLQHKAPREAAAFLQRKGRAGRLQQMRPWTIVVLSDYGRDRLAYQGYDLLFDPVLRPSPLPIGNRHVMKVQAALGLMDWLALRMADANEGSLWSDLAGPVEEIYYWPSADRHSARQRQLRAAGLLRAVLEDPSALRDLEGFLARSLQLGEADVAAVLWQSPRALVTSVIPMLLRRLESNWRHQTRGPRSDAFSKRVPMPEHIPPNLFSELNLPEVEVVAPARRSGARPWEESMPIAQALRELAPGRVTRRFSVREGAVRHWVPLPSPGTTDVNIDDFLTSYEEIGTAPIALGGGPAAVQCVRPWTAELSVAPDGVNDSQSAQLVWRSQLTPSGVGHSLELPETRWSSLIRGLSFHTHGTRSEVGVGRFAVGSEATDPDNAERTITTRFVRRAGDSVEPVAMGYATTADAVRLEIAIPSVWPDDPEVVHALRRGWFVHQVQESDLLRTRASVFSRNWLATLYLAAVTATAATNDVGTSAARQLIEDADVGRTLLRAMDVVFEVPTDADDGTAQHAARQRTADRLRDFLADSTVCSHLHQLGASLEESLPKSAQDWLVRTLGVTVAAALKEAFQRLAPRLDVDSLLIEFDRTTDLADAGSVVVWLTEPTVGGGGVVEQLVQETLSSPRRLLRLAEAAAGETDYEVTDRAQRGLVRLATDEPDVADLLAAFRAATSPDEKRSALQRTLGRLAEAGLPSGVAVAAAASARLLRPGTSPATDEVLRGLVDEMGRLEEQLGFEPEARGFAFALRNRFPLESAVAAPAANMGESWRFAQIYSLMWPHGADARSAGLNAYNRFASLATPERLLVEALFADRRKIVDVTLSDWRQSADEALAADGEVILVGRHERRDQVRRALLDLALHPTDLGFIYAYPQVVGMRARGDDVHVEVELPEAP
jgi:hypothetical protein